MGERSNCEQYNKLLPNWQPVQPQRWGQDICLCQNTCGAAWLYVSAYTPGTLSGRHEILQDVELVTWYAHAWSVFFLCSYVFLFFFKGCMLNSFGTPSCVEAPSSKKKSPIRLIANCATIHFPYPAGHHIPVHQNKSATLDKDTHTQHTVLLTHSAGHWSAVQGMWRHGRSELTVLSGTAEAGSHIHSAGH